MNTPLDERPGNAPTPPQEQPVCPKTDQIKLAIEPGLDREQFNDRVYQWLDSYMREIYGVPFSDRAISAFEVSAPDLAADGARVQVKFRLAEDIIALGKEERELGMIAPIESDATGFLKFWYVFPMILPRSLRDRVYTPSHEELKEDYIRAVAKWSSGWPRYYTKLAFTVRTACLVFECAWVGLGSKIQKLTLGLVCLLLGDKLVIAVRERLVQWFGLP
jgi:hypothetical protein